MKSNSFNNKQKDQKLKSKNQQRRFSALEKIKSKLLTSNDGSKSDRRSSIQMTDEISPTNGCRQISLFKNDESQMTFLRLLSEENELDAKLQDEQDIEQESSDMIRVVARFRPFNEIEKSIKGEHLVSELVNVTYQSSKSVKIQNPQTKNSGHFEVSLDHIFPSETNQQQFYEKTVRRTVSEVLNGYNGTILTYGHSATGKTFSMYGNDIFDQEEKGIVPRTMSFFKQRTNF